MKIRKNAFRFCRFSLMMIVWLGFFLKSRELILLSFILLLSSAALKIRRAPLVFLYTNTIEKLFPSKSIELDERGMRFAHSLGAFLSGVCTACLYLGLQAWGLVLLFAILKTISALGFCPGEKLYRCMSGGCCSILKR